jgi:hypothetical protein
MAIESWKYGNPEDFIDRIRSVAKHEEIKKKRDRYNKAKRIQALVKRVMKNGGSR